MKIRNGFVSNSSSSSFAVVMFGVSLGLNEMINKILLGSEADLDIKEDVSDCYDQGAQIGVMVGDLDCFVYETEDTVYLGKCLTRIDDDQTMREFKDDVKSCIKKLVGSVPDKHFRIIDESFESEDGGIYWAG